MLESLKEIGKTVVSWPQLGPTASMGGAFLTYCIERIANSKPMESGRHVISLDAILDPAYSSAKETDERNTTIEAFKNMFNL